MDGRRETVYGSNVIADHLRFYFGTSDEWRYAEQLKADYVWIPKHLAVARTLQMHGWSTLCAGETSILLTRQASHQAVRVVRVSDSYANLSRALVERGDSRRHFAMPAATRSFPAFAQCSAIVK